MKFNRVILIVLDSVGIGAAPDAARFGDENSDTLGNIARWAKAANFNFRVPNLSRWGLTELLPSLRKSSTPAPQAAHGILIESSPGKDTTTGHWEIAGCRMEQDFSYFPKGFPDNLLQKLCKLHQLPGWLANKTASGTAVIEEYGDAHRQSGKPIIYTSADSVMQIACSEETFGLERLYALCRTAREMLNDYHVGRVIARPFVGNSKSNFKRTEHRKDFSMVPTKNHLLDLLVEEKCFVAGVGKIKDIFAERSVTLSNPTTNNETSFAAILDFLKKTSGKSGLIFANLIDFDQNFGHRRNPQGYAECIMRFDEHLPELENLVDEKDLVIITADHGNDPTHSGTDHTRENVPLFVWSKSKKIAPLNLGLLQNYGHIARLTLEAMGLTDSAKKLACYSQTESIWNAVGLP